MRRRETFRFVSLLCALAVVSFQADAAGPRVTVDIPAGPAPRTFQLFFAQTRIEILYLADAVKDVQTSEIRGTLDADEAVKKMIANTKLEYQFFQNYSFVSLRPKGSRRGRLRARTRMLCVSCRGTYLLRVSRVAGLLRFSRS